MEINEFFFFVGEKKNVRTFSIKAGQDELATDEQQQKSTIRMYVITGRFSSVPPTETEPGTIPMVAGVSPIIYVNFSFEIMAFDDNPTGHKLARKRAKKNFFRKFNYFCCCGQMATHRKPS